MGNFVYLGTQRVSPLDCLKLGIRCFTPHALQNTYGLPALYAQGLNGGGQTIAIIDAFGSSAIRSDLNVFSTTFALPHLCGEARYTCRPGDATFSTLQLQGAPATVSHSTDDGAGLQSSAPWIAETTLDVEWAHAVAPRASILLVTTPTAETLGVQGFPQMIAAEDYVIKHHLASVISQSFASAEEAFSSPSSLQRLRYAFKDALAGQVTVLASSGDNGTANVRKQPVHRPQLIPYPTVEWPASDPLVTAVGGTSVCTDAATGLKVDSVNPPTACQDTPGQREVAWPASGGGFSHVFARPAYQDGVVGRATRGLPDVAYQADPATGVIVFVTTPGNPGDWFSFGGTSSGSPQWAGLVAIACQINGGPLGYLNPALYRIATDPARRGADFHDVTVGNNQIDPTIPGFFARPGWDAVTGWGTPNAARLLPDLVAAVRGQ
ncbi:MAG: protease [Chloroflexi bacterium]|nr:MAG: protease [Chloroflexota bacterium]